MKKIIYSLIFITALTLSACGGKTELKTKASTPNGFEKVSTDDFGNKEIIVFRHKETGCHYLMIDGWSRKNGGLAQMFVKESGASVPYCD